MIQPYGTLSGNELYDMNSIMELEQKIQFSYRLNTCRSAWVQALLLLSSCGLTWLLFPYPTHTHAHKHTHRKRITFGVTEATNRSHVVAHNAVTSNIQ